MFPQYAGQAYPSHAGMYGAPAGVGPGAPGAMFGAYPQQPALSAPPTYPLAQGSVAFQSGAATTPGMTSMTDYLPAQPLASQPSASTEAVTGLGQPGKAAPSHPACAPCFFSLFNVSTCASADVIPGQFTQASSVPQQFTSREQSTPLNPFKEPDPV